jgi:quinol monooxygenase YgiN
VDERVDELIVVNRFRVGEEPGAAAEFRTAVHAALDALAARPGYAGGRVGRNVDDPGLWLLTTTWANIGSYRRALSAYDVKLAAVPLLSRAVDEPSAFEPVTGEEPLNRQVPRELG